MVNVMVSRVDIVNAVKYVCSGIFFLGIIMFFIGIFENDYIMLTSIGIGTVIAAVFIFIIGMFFVATEEMLETRYDGIKVVPMEKKKIV